MLRIFLFSTTLVLGISAGLPPVMIQQPVDVEILFKTSALGDRHKPFEIQCDAEGDPLPK